jgi:hypothetical protein
MTNENPTPSLTPEQHQLTLEPSPYAWPMYDAFREELTKAGVWTSNIPIRTA